MMTNYPESSFSYAPLVKVSDRLAARLSPGPRDKVLWLHDYALDSSCWGELWELLPGWYHIGLDLPGHGVSLPPRPKETLPEVARSIVRVALAHEARHLVALGFGTTIALQMAIENPCLFSSIVLASPALGGGPFEDGMICLYRELVTMFRLYGFGPYLRERLMQPPSVLFSGAARRPELWGRLWRIVGRHGWWDLVDGTLLRLMDQPQSIAQLRRIEARGLVIVGEQDFAASGKCGTLIRDALPSGQYLELSGAGHLCLLEDPWASRAAIDLHLRNEQKTRMAEQSASR